MFEGREASAERNNCVNELKSWLDCLNRSWIDDERQIDIVNGGSAADVVSGALRRLMTKMARLPVEDVAAPTLEVA